MRVNDFIVGTMYRIKLFDWESPDGDIVPGKELLRCILEPVNESNSAFEDGPAPSYILSEWMAFLRVQNPDTGDIHLLNPERIEFARALQ